MARRRTRVVLSTVAAAAEVSEATVSRVINNRGVVAPDTRRAVEDAMRRVGYSPRNAAPRMVLLITPGLRNPFFAQLGERIAQQLAPQGLQALLATTEAGAGLDYEYVAGLIDNGMVGAVFISANNTLLGADPTAHELLSTRNVPYVCIDAAFAGSSAPALTTNDRLASELAVAHLWALGHRRIGLIAGHIGNIPSDRRADGFEQAITSRGGTSAPVVRTEYTVEGGADAARRLTAQEVTAIVAASDELAFGALRYARQVGLDVPRDLSIVGYDDVYPLEFVDPPLTSLRQPIDRLAKSSVSMLMRMIDGMQVEPVELLYDPELMVRESTAPPSHRR